MALSSRPNRTSIESEKALASLKMWKKDEKNQDADGAVASKATDLVQYQGQKNVKHVKRWKNVKDAYGRSKLEEEETDSIGPL